MSTLLETIPSSARRYGVNSLSETNPELVVGLRCLKQRVWFVDSNVGITNGNGASWASAVDTLQEGIDLAGVDDLVLVAAAHAENVATASAITLNKAGLTVLGQGNRNRRPTFTYTGTAATILVSAADAVLSNVLLTCSTDEVVTLLSVTGARATIDRVDYVSTTAAQAIQFLLTTAAADGISIQNCKHHALTAAAAAQLWIELVGTDFARVVDNELMLVLSNSATSTAINITTTAAIQVLIARNYICQTGGTTQDNFISLVANTTGIAADNRIGGDVGTLAASVDLASAYGSENFVATTANKSGILDPVVA